MPRVVVYSKAGCPFCSLLKLELNKRRIGYEELDLSDDAVRAQFYEISGTRSVPQLYVTDDAATLTAPSGVSFGGYSDVSKDWNRLEKIIA